MIRLCNFRQFQLVRAQWSQLHSCGGLAPEEVMSDNWSEEWKRSDAGADREQHSGDGVPGDDDDDYDDHDGDHDD